MRPRSIISHSIDGRLLEHDGLERTQYLERNTAGSAGGRRRCEQLGAGRERRETVTQAFLFEQRPIREIVAALHCPSVVRAPRLLQRASNLFLGPGPPLLAGRSFAALDDIAKAFIKEWIAPDHALTEHVLLHEPGD